MIIITGSSSGLGNKITEMLLEFDNIICTHFKNEIYFGNKNLKSQYLDLTDYKSIDKFITKNKNSFNNLTLKIYPLIARMDIYDYDNIEWKKTFDVNVNGPFYLIKIIASNDF